MAKKIDPATITPAPKGVRPKYPWNEWTDGEWWLAERGTDYTVTTESFRSTLSNHAVKKNLRVTTKTTETGIAFQFTDKETQ